MKHPALVLLLAATLSTSAAMAQKVFVDYDVNYDRSVVKTFAWADSPETSLAGTNGLMHSRIVNAIEHHLAQAGLEEVASDPDVFVTYHTDTANEVRFDTSTWGYGYPSSFYYDPYWPGYYGSSWGTTSTTTVREYTRGTLIVDVWDSGTDKLVWRGTASAIVPDKPSKAEKKLYSAIDKMIRKWDKLKAQEAKARR